MAGTTRGEPAGLRAYSSAMLARVRASDATLASYQQAMARLHAAPTDLPIDVPDRSGDIAGQLAELRAVDQQPARFATALELADRVAFLGPSSSLGRLLGRFRSQLGTDAAVAAELRADQLTDELRELLAGDADLEAIYDDLARILAQLDDPAIAAAVFEQLRADDLLALLQLIHEAQLTKQDQTFDGNGWIADREPMTDLLAPLGLAFETAVAMGAISEGFVDRLFSAPPPGELGWPSTTMLLSQLLVYGDPMGAGDAAVTAAFASMVLSDGYQDATRMLYGVGTAYVDPDEPDLFAGMFHLEHLVGHAAASLAADPAAAYRFLLDGRNQTALLDRAAEGWWLGGDHGVSEILEGGLLVHPHELGVFDRSLDSRHRDSRAYLAAVQHLIADVADRGSVDGSAARGLGIVLAPHDDSISGQAGRPPRDGPLGLDLATYRGYLANVARHDVGLAALQETYAGWTAATYLEWGDELSGSSHLSQVPRGFLGDTARLVETYRLLEDALHDANVSHEDSSALLLGAIDRAGGLARSRVLRWAKLPGGPVSFVAGEATSWTTRQVTGWAKDQVLAGGPMDVTDFQTVLAHALPQLVVGVLVEAVPAEDRAELVPVAPGTRPYTTERDASRWERITFWRDPDLSVTVDVEFGAWPPEVLDGWLAENLAAYDLPSGVDAEDWWLYVIVEDVRKGFPPPVGGIDRSGP